MIGFLLELNAFALVVKFDQLADALIAILFFAAVGLVILGIAYFVLHLVLPFSLRLEIEEKQNPALGILIASLIAGIAIIVAAAI